MEKQIIYAVNKEYLMLLHKAHYFCRYVYMYIYSSGGLNNTSSLQQLIHNIIGAPTLTC